MFKLRFLFLVAALLFFFRTNAQNITDLAPTVTHSNKIDKITSAKEIEHLLKSIDRRFTGFKVNTLKWNDKDYQKLCDSLQVKPFEKADFDNNGYTDLLVIGEQPFLDVYCIMDSGGNKFVIKTVSRHFEDCLPVVSTSVNETFITNYNFKYNNWGTVDSPHTITSTKLVYKYGGFIEYYDSSKSYGIEKIEYSTTACYGPCPIFSFVINSDRTAEYVARMNNNPNGKFKGIIDEVSYKELIDLLNYIDFPSLKNDYRVAVTDQQASTLTITYNGGKTKVINDYGLLGTYGLRRAYEILFRLRESEEWE